jgi:hypothetical protein
MAGAFQTSRDIFQSDIWENPVEFRLFFFIYGNAVFSEEGIEKGGIRIERGQYLRSYRNLQKDLQYIENRSVKTYSTSRIKTAVDRLVKQNRLKIEDTELGTLFTVVNYATYQGLENYKKVSENAERTQREQRENNNKNVKEGKEGKSNNKKRHTFDETQMKLAVLLWKYVQKNDPSMKHPNLESWANDIRLMMQIDKREGKEIQDVILWATKDEFWHKNILSAVKLRKHFDKLKMQMRKSQTKVIPGGKKGYAANQPVFGESHSTDLTKEKRAW